MKLLFKRVVYLCKRYNISYYALEKAAHLSDGSIKRWDKSPPSCDRLMRVARYFGVSIDFLLGLTDNPVSHLNKDTFDRATKELKNQIETWQNQLTVSKEELYSSIGHKLLQYGLISTSDIDIDAAGIMNDPELPR